MDVNKIQPINNSVIIKPYEGITKTESGFEVSRNNDNKVPMIGTVVKASSDSKWKKGEILIFRRFSADEIKSPGQNDEEEKFYLLKDEDALATYSGTLVE